MHLKYLAVIRISCLISQTGVGYYRNVYIWIEPIKKYEKKT